MNLIYCYDAYCGWCYGFSPVVKKINDEYEDQLFVEVLSGGMILPDMPQPIGVMASLIQSGYKRVEEYTGVTFGEDYLWHVFNADKSDWFPDSLKPAIALCIIKDHSPAQGLEFASDIQYALHFEGRDLTDNEAYRHLLSKYAISEERFYNALGSQEYLEKAKYEFALVKQLQVTSYPTLLLQETETKFHLLAKGYTDLETLRNRLDRALTAINEN